MSQMMTHTIMRLLPWAAMAIAGVALAVTQLGDGLIVQRPEARMPLFLLGAVVATAGVLKLAAVATDPESRHRRNDGSQD